MSDLPDHQRSPLLWDKFKASVGRITVATIIAVPATGILTVALFLVPPPVALGIGICGMVSLRAGAQFNKPSLIAIGGVTFLAGVLSWALRQ